MSLEGFENAVNLINLQLARVRRPEVGKVNITPFDSNHFSIAEQHDEYYIFIDSENEVTKYPSWMRCHREGTLTQLSCNSTKYLPEVLYLLSHCWRKLNASEDELDVIVIDALQHLKSRWNGLSEPMSEENQRGLIGELEALRKAALVYGIEAIKGWDATSHSLQDISTPEWLIEAKSKSQNSTKVRISSFEQLKVNDSRPLYLSVTEIERRSTGITLPEYCNSLLMDMRSSKIDGIEFLESLLDSIGSKTEDLFKTKFEVGETKFFLIERNSSPDLMGRIELPDGCSCGPYDLELEQFEPCEFE